MRERPILFSGAMVRAILDGRKTQTRRPVKPQPTSGVDGWDWSWPIPGKNVTPGTRDYWRDDAKNPLSPRYCPYGKPGDRLWVRETFSRLEAFDFFNPDVPEDVPGFWYWADGEPTWGDWTRPKPSIHMPREACRIQLEITDVRVEKLNDCSETDAKAEGAVCIDEATGREVLFPIACNAGSYCLGYQHLWNSINGAGAWEANPWVWVVEFRPDLSPIIPKR